MTALSAFLQGVLQGLTEFLPVSSSGHLSLFQYFTGISSGSSAAFSVLLHLGTFLAVLIAFRRTVTRLAAELVRMLGDLVTGRIFRGGRPSPERRMLCCLMLSCAPLLLVLPLRSRIAAIGADQDVVAEGICFLVTAGILTWGDRAAAGSKTAGGTTGRDALLVGAAQCLATLPGVSRSGATIATGQVRGFDRNHAVTYSFILGLPAVLAAGILDLGELAETGWGDLSPVNAVLGMATAAVFGLLAIRLVKRLMAKGRFTVFADYTLVLGIITVILGIMEHATGRSIQTTVLRLIG